MPARDKGGRQSSKISAIEPRRRQRLAEGGLKAMYVTCEKSCAQDTRAIMLLRHRIVSLLHPVAVIASLGSTFRLRGHASTFCVGRIFYRQTR